ncbi:hydroxyacid dehydrogenase [Streptomyces sp. NPDC020681]|uniref:hydroxyacid dehydrogenase n=1 Tax=Streptomyces sp. NPDC020681 TaxID=3365083 RepID=UPI00379E0D78
MPKPEGTQLNSTANQPPSAQPRTVLGMGRSVHDRLHRDGMLDRLLRTATVDTTLVLTAGDGSPGPALAEALAGAEVLFTHWGCPPLTEDTLRAMPKLRAVIHAAGSVKHHVTDAVWARGIAVSSAAAANALPVAEYTLAAILFANKGVLDSARSYRRTRAAPDHLAGFSGLGNYRRTVGIVGASRIGRRVVELLAPFDLDVLLHDPYLGPADAAALGAEATGLDDLVRRSHVVSIHAPQLPETHHMFDADRLGLLCDGATLINTSRGSLVDTRALTEQLRTGRISAVLDVTEPDVPPADSPLYDLPNVLLTPHVAGSLGNELGRMTDWAVDELERYARGLPFVHEVGPSELARSA